MSFCIKGTGSYVPELVVTNDDLAKMVDTSDEWIVQRVGVRERRISVDKSAADMGCIAAQRALENAGIAASELDLIVAASISNDEVCPTVAGAVQRQIGATCPAFDVSSACSGFLFALETADSFIAAGKAERVLVLGAERISKLIDWSDRSTCVIFGDGAGAAVIERGEGLLSSKICTEGGDEVIKIPIHPGTSPFYKKETDAPFVFMNGQETFRFAVTAMSEDVKEVVGKAGLTLDDVDWIVPHQANMRIISFAAKKLRMPEEKFFVNIEKCGNTSAASVPIALDELNRSGKLKRGQIVVLSAFGGGLSKAAAVIRW